MSTKELYDLFKAKAEGVSGEIYSTADVNEAIEVIKKVVKELHGNGEKGKVLWLKDELTKSIDLSTLEADLGPIYTDNFRENAPDGLVGISEVEFAIADTGTVCMDATDINKRLISSLPTVHIAILKKENILPDMLTTLTKYSGKVPGHLSFITGPSRTSDIERVLTIGVHGPCRFIAIFIGKEEVN